MSSGSEDAGQHAATGDISIAELVAGMVQTAGVCVSLQRTIVAVRKGDGATAQLALDQTSEKIDRMLEILSKLIERLAAEVQ